MQDKKAGTSADKYIDRINYVLSGIARDGQVLRSEKMMEIFQQLGAKTASRSRFVF